MTEISLARRRQACSALFNLASVPTKDIEDPGSHETWNLCWSDLVEDCFMSKGSFADGNSRA